MKALCVLALFAMYAAVAFGNEIVVQRVQGDVLVRHGVDENWEKVKPGQLLRPQDTMRTGKKSSAVLQVRSDSETNQARKIRVPDEVVLDLLDVRELTQEELMLKLTMEKVRVSADESDPGTLTVPNTTIVHGEKPSSSLAIPEDELEMATLQINGTKVLFANGYYSTCALKTGALLQRYPHLGEKFENRLQMAESLERAQVRGEALKEYAALSSSATLSKKQRTLIDDRVARLRQLMNN